MLTLSQRLIPQSLNVHITKDLSWALNTTHLNTCDYICKEI